MSNYNQQKKKMVQGPFALPFKVQKECKEIFITYIYLHLFPQWNQNQGQNWFSKVQSLPSDSVCPSIFNAANHRVHLRKCKLKIKSIKTSFPLFSEWFFY